MLLKKLLTLKIVKYEFFKVSISHILKKLKVRNAIFFLGIRYMLLANNRTQKTAKTMHVAYFLSKNLFCKKTLRPKNCLNL